jgi:hypothetical protein
MPNWKVFSPKIIALIGKYFLKTKSLPGKYFLKKINA